MEALNALIANSDITVQVDNPQKQDLSGRIAEIRNQYENVAQQNRAEAENWYKTKVGKNKEPVTVIRERAWHFFSP